MKVFLVVVMLLGALVVSFALVKMAGGIQTPIPQTTSDAAIELKAGQMTPAVFVPSQAGQYEGPCEAVCKGGLRGTLLFSEVR